MPATFAELGRQDFETPSDSEGEYGHLQNRLKENSNLKAQLKRQDAEINSLKRANQDLEAKVTMASEGHLGSESLSLQSPQVAHTIVQLKKKNRDLTCHVESMKTKMQQLLNQSENLKARVDELEKERAERGGAVPSNSKSTEEIMNAATQLTETTKKMMEYRRQYQQLKLEHKVALRALVQEIGDESVNSKNVLSFVGNPSWRGRQQQILTLNQKIVELQNRLAYMQVQQEQQQAILQLPYSIDSENHGGNSGRSHSSQLTYTVGQDDETRQDSQNYNREIALERLSQAASAASIAASCTASSATQRHLADLQLQDKKKHEQIDKLIQELDETKKELRHFQQERKAFKARTLTLESQIKSCRIEVEQLQSKLQDKKGECASIEDELNQTRKELHAAKQREHTVREDSSIEIYDIQQALNRERTKVAQLQVVLGERQELIETMDSDIKRLQSKLNACSNQNQNSGRASEQLTCVIKKLKSQVHESTNVIKEFERERQELLKHTDKLIVALEDERMQHTHTQNRLVKSFAVVDEANNCIGLCLDESQIMSQRTLEHVEGVRSLVREIKTTGSLYSLETIPIEELPQLKRKVALLSKENSILHSHAKRSLDDRRRDLEQYGALSTQLRSEFLRVLQSATTEFQQ